jgi:hypothetical protein
VDSIVNALKWKALAGQKRYRTVGGKMKGEKERYAGALGARDRYTPFS